QRADAPAVPDVAAAIDPGIGVENLAPASEERNFHPVIPIDLRGEIDHDEATLVGLTALAQPGEDAAVGVMHDQPFETGGIAIELVQRRQAAVEAIEIADQGLDAAMQRPLEQMPVERMVVPPLLLLAELGTHEQELLAGMPEHETVIGAQV